VLTGLLATLTARLVYVYSLGHHIDHLCQNGYVGQVLSHVVDRTKISAVPIKNTKMFDCREISDVVVVVERKLEFSERYAQSDSLLFGMYVGV